MTTPLETAQKYYTAEEFMDLDLDPNYRYELVRGVIQQMSHPKTDHTLVGANLSMTMGAFLLSKKTGKVLPPGSFELRIPGETRDTVRSPDVAVVTNEQVSRMIRSESIKLPPELAIEIYSPNDRPGKLHEKLEDYQQAGWNLVWVVYPLITSPRKKAGTVEIYKLQEETGLQPAQILNQTDTLVGEGNLEGFTMPVQEIFA